MRQHMHHEKPHIWRRHRSNRFEVEEQPPTIRREHGCCGFVVCAARRQLQEHRREVRMIEQEVKPRSSHAIFSDCPERQNTRLRCLRKFG